MSQQVVINHLFRFCHRILKQTASDFDRHDLAVGDVVFDESAELGTFASAFFTQ